MNLSCSNKSLPEISVAAPADEGNTITSFSGFSVRFSGSKRIVELRDIVYLKSAKNYTVFKLCSGRELISSRTLKTYEEELNEEVNFVRAHRSYMVNFDYVRNIDLNCRGGEIQLIDETIDISRRKAASFRKQYKRFLSLQKK